MPASSPVPAPVADSPSRLLARPRPDRRPVLSPLPPRPSLSGREAPVPTREPLPAVVAPLLLTRVLVPVALSTSIAPAPGALSTGPEGGPLSGAPGGGACLCRPARSARIRVSTTSSAACVPSPTLCEVRPSACLASGLTALDPGMTPNGFLPSKSGLVWTSAHCRKGWVRRVCGVICSSVNSESNCARSRSAYWPIRISPHIHTVVRMAICMSPPLLLRCAVRLSSARRLASSHHAKACTRCGANKLALLPNACVARANESAGACRGSGGVV